VAEMTVFVGSWQVPDLFHRTATILATMSIVVTAVYILRGVGVTLWGPIKNEFAQLTDAAWNEKLASIILVASIIVMGTMPWWLSDMISKTTETLFGAVIK